MSYLRTYKDILKVQLEFVNHILSDIVVNYKDTPIREIVNHVSRYASCEMFDDIVRVNFGEVYGYLKVSSNSESVIDSFYNMDEAGLDSTGYYALIEELDRIPDEVINKGVYFECYDLEMTAYKKYSLYYKNINSNDEISISTDK